MAEEPKKKTSRLTKVIRIMAMIMIMLSVSFIILYIAGANVLDCEETIRVFILYQDEYGYTDGAMKIYDAWLNKCGYMLDEQEHKALNVELYENYDKWKKWNP